MSAPSRAAASLGVGSNTCASPSRPTNVVVVTHWPPTFRTTSSRMLNVTTARVASGAGAVVDAAESSPHPAASRPAAPMATTPTVATNPNRTPLRVVMSLLMGFV